MCSSCVQGSFFLILCTLESAFSEELQVWNLCVLPCKVDGRLPPRSWLAPRLGNRLDWITTTPGIFAPRTLFSQFISLQHFTIQSHTTSTCTDSDKSKWPGLGLKIKGLFVIICQNSLYMHSARGEPIDTCWHWRKICLFPQAIPADCCEQGALDPLLSWFNSLTQQKAIHLLEGRFSLFIFDGFPPTSWHWLQLPYKKDQCIP